MKNKTRTELISELEEARQHIAELEEYQASQMLMEQELREKEERYRLLAENAGDYIWIMELASMRISYASPSVERILGYTPQEAMNISPERRYPPQSLKRIEEVLGEELRKEKKNGLHSNGTRAFKLEAYHKDGHLVWMETTARPIRRNEDGMPTAILGISRDITKRMRTQELLQESTKKLSTTLSSIGDAVIATDTEGCVTLMNPVAEKLTGWLLKEAQGKALSEVFNIINAHTKEKAVNPVLKVLESGRIIGLANHTMLIAKDGTEYQIADSAAPIRDSKGIITGVVLVFRDVTEEYRVREVLQKSEEQFRNIFENAVMGFYRTTPEGKILMANPAAIKMTGYSSFEELSQQNLANGNAILSKETRSTFKKHIENNGQVVGFENVWIKKDGSPLFVRENARGIRDQEGNIIYYEGTVEDITEQVQAKSALRKSEERFRNIFDSGAIGIALVGPDRKFASVNPRFCSMLGYEEEELYRKNFIDIIHPDDVETTQVIMGDFLQKRPPFLKFQNKHVKKDGQTLYSQVTVSAISGGDENEIYVLSIIEDITERVQAENALRESEDKFSKAFYLSPNSISITILKTGEILDVNKGFESMLGYRRHEVVGKTTSELVIWVNPPERQKMIEMIQKEGRIQSYEATGRKKSGEYFIGDISAEIIEIDNEQCLLLIVRDVTERKRTEEALRESEERFRNIFDSGAIGIALAGEDRKLSTVNPRFCQMLGYEEAELKTKTFLEITHPDDIQTSIKFMEDFATEEQPFAKTEKRYIKKNGQILHGQTTISKIPTGENTPPYTLGIIEDITERIHAERALRESEEKFRGLVEASSDWIWEVNVDGVYTYTSPQIEEILGYTPEEVIGKSSFEFMLPEEAKRVKKIFDGLAKSGMPIISMENVNLHKNGHSVILETSGVPFFGESGKILGYRGVDRDITGRKKYKHEREGLVDDLAHRSMLLQTAANISKSVLAILSPDELLQKTVELIQQHFNYYYVGLFLVDEAEDFLVLQAGTGEAGKEMLAAKHKLKINNESMVGWSTANAKARIALDLTEEVFRFKNPLLSKTRSEMALPLVVHAKAIGALTVQSADEAAFTDEDIAALQTMADQLAIAIQNAQLYEQAQKDIEERIQAEKALKESEKNFRLLFEHSPLGTYIADPSGKILDANQTLLNILGSPSLEATRKINILTFPPLTQIGYSKKFQQCVDSAKTAFFEFPYTSKWGKKLLLSSYIVPLINSAGKVEKLYTIMEDITKRKEAEQELHHLRNYLANIIDSMPSILIGVDAEGKVTQWNIEAQRTSGLPSTKVLGQPLEEILPRLSPQLERVQQAMTTREVQMPPRKSYLKDGETYYEDITIYPLVANGVEGAVIRIDDVTEQVRIEELMIQSEKMLSVGGLAAGMAHEINNPLAGMMQTASVMSNRLSNLEMPANLRAAEAAGASMESIGAFMESRGIPRMLTAINESGQRVAEIVDNMLSFARRSDAAVTTINLTELLDKTLELAATDYDLKKQYDFKTIKIVKEYDDYLPYAPCEGGKIQQVFLNILRNGAQAMHDARGNGEEPCFTLRVSHETEVDMIRVEIEDNGPGMDEATRKRVFEPFFTTKPVGDGTGLGLSVSYFIIAENHGGTLDVVSKPNQGAKFIIRLPVRRRNT